MAKELSVNKNTDEIYEFYKTKLIDPKNLKGKNVLILELGNITYIDEIKKYAKNVCVIDRAYNCIFGDVFENINTLEIQIKKFLEKNKMPKFDLSIMNPPYDGNLHLEILNSVYTCSKQVINIAPIEWLMNCYGSQDSKKFESLKFTNINYVGLLKDIFNGCDRSTLHMGIYELDAQSKLTAKNFQTKFVTIDNKSFIKQSFIKSFINKIQNHDIFLEDVIKTGEIDNTTKWTIVVPRLVGNPGQKCYKLFVKNSRWDKIFNKGVCNGITPSENKKKLKNVSNYTVFDYIEFNTKKEAQNWCLSWDSKFLKFAQIIQSIDSNRRCKYTPFMKDYSSIWDDKRFCDYFGITGYIDDEHAVKGSEWEIILNTMKEFE